MQKIMFVVLATALFSCRSEENKPAETKGAKDAKETVSANLPYTATYSSKFEIGDTKNAEAILKLWKSWDDNDMKTAKSLFADTMSFYLRDGSEMVGKTDSIIVGAQAFRDMFSTVKSTVHAYMPLKSTDKNENWVCIWGTEVSTSKQGKVDSVNLQETWRFNKDGKIDLVYQFGRAFAAPK